MVCKLGTEFSLPRKAFSSKPGKDDNEGVKYQRILSHDQNDVILYKKNQHWMHELSDIISPDIKTLSFSNRQDLKGMTVQFCV